MVQSRYQNRGPFQPPLRGRQPMPFQSPVRPPRQAPNQQPGFRSPNGPASVQMNDLLSRFRKADGGWDMRKISSSATQMMGYYDQFKKFSPMLMRFLGR